MWRTTQVCSIEPRPVKIANNAPLAGSDHYGTAAMNPDPLNGVHRHLHVVIYAVIVNAIVRTARCHGSGSRRGGALLSRRPANGTCVCVRRLRHTVRPRLAAVTRGGTLSRLRRSDHAALATQAAGVLMAALGDGRAIQRL